MLKMVANPFWKIEISCYQWKGSQRVLKKIHLDWGGVDFLFVCSECVPKVIASSSQSVPWDIPNCTSFLKSHIGLPWFNFHVICKWGKVHKKISRTWWGEAHTLGPRLFFFFSFGEGGVIGFVLFLMCSHDILNVFSSSSQSVLLFEPI